MTEKPESFDRIVVLADESADWKLAGLRQLDRLVFALDELSESILSAPGIDIVVLWRPDIAIAARWLPCDPRIKCVRVGEDISLLRSGVRVIGSRLFVDRNALREYLNATPAVRLTESMVDPQNCWQQLNEKFETSCDNSLRTSKAAHWKYLKRADDIRDSEDIFLRRAGKSQDGIVSRFVNRPLTRPVTHLLLKLPITPTGWTLAIFVLAILAFAFVLRGNYASIVIGSALYQLYSMLDGCDGEIARAKYLESKRGGQIDSFCDMLGGFLFVIGLGLGLSRVAVPHSDVYAVEGVLSALFIALHEWLLMSSKQEPKDGSGDLTGAFYSRHRQLIEQSGVLFLGEKFVWWILQLTKRDVTILFFLLLAVANQAQWILHYSVVAAAIGVALSAITRLKTRGAVAVSRPPS